MLTCRGFIGSFFISENSDRCGNQRKNFSYNSHARVAAFGDCARVRIFVPGTSDSGVRKSVRRHSGVFAAQNIRMKTKKTTSKSLIPVWLLKVGSSRCIFLNSCNPVFKLYPLQPVVHRLGGNPEKENC